MNLDLGRGKTSRIRDFRVVVEMAARARTGQNTSINSLTQHLSDIGLPTKRDTVTEIIKDAQDAFLLDENYNLIIINPPE